MQFSCFFTVFLFLSAPVAASDTDLRFLRGLVDRDLFESAEIFCQDEFRSEKVLPAVKLSLASELVRARTRQMLLAEPEKRTEIRKRIDELETRFDTPPTEPKDDEYVLAKTTFRFQSAISDFSLGDWQRLEADVAPESEREERIKEARQSLYDSLERFKQCHEEITALRRPDRNDRDFERRTLALSWAVRSQWSLAQLSLALTFPPGGDRVYSLNEAVKMLSELASLRVADPVVYRSRIELARCYRLLGESERSKEQLVILDGVKLSEELMLEAKAELIRHYLAAGAVDEAIRLFDVEEPAKTVCPDYDVARLELLLAESVRVRQVGAARQEAVARLEIDAVLGRIIALVRLIEQRSGPYWGRRARMVLSSSHWGEPGSDVDAELVKMLADDQFQSGRFADAVRLYRQASRVAEDRGDSGGAFRYAAAGVAVLADVQDRLTAAVKNGAVVPPEEFAAARQRLIESIRDLSERFPDHPDSAEYHLKAIDLTADAVREKIRHENTGETEEPAGLDVYVELLKEHAERWPESRKVPPSLLRAALLVEQQGKADEALGMLEKIPNSAAVGLEAVQTAERCFETLPDTPENRLREAEWFERRLPTDPETWVEADAASALRAAECRLKLFSPTDEKTKEHSTAAEKRLRAAESCPDLSPARKARIQAMLVRTLAVLGRRDEGAEVLRNLDDDRIKTLAPEERREFQRVRAQLLAETGKTQEAVNLLGELEKRYPDDLAVVETLAEILTRRTEPKALNAAQRYWSKIVTKSNPKFDIWWTARQRIIEIHLKLGQIEEAEKQLELLRLLHPELGGPARKAKLEKLLQ